VSKNSFDFGWISAIEEPGATIGMNPYGIDSEAKPSLPVASSVTAKKGMAGRNPPSMLLPAKFEPLAVERDTLSVSKWPPRMGGHRLNLCERSTYVSCSSLGFFFNGSLWFRR
jgi:hypothetical protein